MAQDVGKVVSLTHRPLVKFNIKNYYYYYY